MNNKTEKVIVWRKSVFDNKYKCTRCNRVLWIQAESAKPQNTIVIGDSVYCDCCGYDVGRLTSINSEMLDYLTPSDSGDLGKAYKDYSDRKIAEYKNVINGLKSTVKKLEDTIASIEVQRKQMSSYYEARIDEQRKTIDLLSKENNSLNRELRDLEKANSL